MRRRKNSILAALEVLRDRHPNLTVSDVRVFAAIARGRQTLAAIALETGLSKQTASRCARSFLSARSAFALAPQADLVTVELSRRNNRTRLFNLNAAGEAVRSEVDALIAARRPILIDRRGSEISSSVAA